MLVIFDLDGTLVDSSAALLKAHEAAFASIGLAPPEPNKILERVGLPLIQTMRLLAPDHDAEALARVYSRAYAEAAAQSERLFAGVKGLLTHSFRAAIATGKSQRGAERSIRRHGLGERFEIVLGGNSVPNPKPAPDLVRSIMAATKTKDVIMVGDTTFDLEMAAAAGVPAIGVSWGHHSQERLERWAPVVHSVDELGHALGVV